MTRPGQAISSQVPVNKKTPHFYYDPVKVWYVQIGEGFLDPSQGDNEQAQH
jgi:hypothetical protein